MVVTGLADGKPVTSEGRPSKYGFISTRIGNIDKYKVRRLEIHIGQSVWTLDNPRQQFLLREGEE